MILLAEFSPYCISQSNPRVLEVGFEILFHASVVLSSSSESLSNVKH